MYLVKTEKLFYGNGFFNPSLQPCFFLWSTSSQDILLWFKNGSKIEDVLMSGHYLDVSWKSFLNSLAMSNYDIIGLLSNYTKAALHPKN